MVCHSIILNVESGTSRGVVEIPQSDNNSHKIVFRVVTNKGPMNLKGFVPSVSFYRSYDDKTFTTVGASRVDNEFRGFISYAVSSGLVEFTGRLVGELTLTDDIHCRKLSCKFILNVIEDPRDKSDESSVEVIITQEFYDSLVNHLGNQEIHLTAEDRGSLDFINENFENFVYKTTLADDIKADEEVGKHIKSIADKSVSEALTWDLSLLDEGGLFHKKASIYLI